MLCLPEAHLCIGELTLYGADSSVSGVRGDSPGAGAPTSETEHRRIPIYTEGVARMEHRPALNPIESPQAIFLEIQGPVSSVCL